MTTEQNSHAALGWIYLLPSTTQKVIVKYNPKWMISCVLPARNTALTFKMEHYFVNTEGFETVEWKEKTLEVAIPTLLLSHSLVKPWIEASRIEEYFLLHAVELSDDAIRAAIYRLANVYSNGKLCFGEISNEGYPTNLREANSLFWGTPFNDDASPFYDYHSLHCEKKIHENYEHVYETNLHFCKFQRDHQCGCFDGKHSAECLCVTEDCDCACICACCAETCNCTCRCECCLNVCGCTCRCDLSIEYFSWIKKYNDQLGPSYMLKTKFFLGDQYFAYGMPAKALFLSNNPQLADMVPETCWRVDGQKDRFLLGIADQNEDQSWQINLGQTTLTLPNHQLSMI